MTPNLPDFDRPPVIEVVLGVQFQGIGLRPHHAGLLWSEYRERFPRVEEKPALDPAIERFGVPPSKPEPRLALLQGPPPIRFWFLSDTGGELVQVQRDRFIFNWRRVEDDDEYPRYTTVEREFFAAYGTFVRFLGEQGLGAPEIGQCEVCYVNHIRPHEGLWSSHGEAAKAVTLLASGERDFLPVPDEVNATASYVIADEDGGPLGRLRIQLQPRTDSESSAPVLGLQLTARGTPLGEGLDGVRAFLRLGHEWIVRGFVDATSPEMQSVWGRR